MKDVFSDILLRMHGEIPFHKSRYWKALKIKTFDAYILTDRIVLPAQAIQNVDFFFTTITQEDIGIIKHAMQSHIDIFQYKEIELPVVLDGVINTFEFMLDENFTNTITAYNIGAFRKDVNIGIIGTHPYKGSTVLQLFDKISKILLEHGVDPKYVRIS